MSIPVERSVAVQIVGDQQLRSRTRPRRGSENVLEKIGDAVEKIR
jgi:hypothetical protein